MRRLAVVAILLASAGALVAQEATEITLSSGFEPDPYTVVIETVPVDWLRVETRDGAYGFYTAGPVILLDYRDAGPFNLYISVESATDTVLAVIEPDGTISAADDVRGLDPGVAIPDPVNGIYEIHVGAYTRAALTATVTISEIGLFVAGRGPGSRPGR